MVGEIQPLCRPSVRGIFEKIVISGNLFWATPWAPQFRKVLLYMPLAGLLFSAHVHYQVPGVRDYPRAVRSSTLCSDPQKISESLFAFWKGLACIVIIKIMDKLPCSDDQLTHLTNEINVTAKSGSTCFYSSFAHCITNAGKCTQTLNMMFAYFWGCCDLATFVFMFRIIL